MNRVLVTAVLAIAATLFAVGPAAAGEITGTGELTPIKALQTDDAPAGPANSVCSFSGLNDGDNGRTQTWGGTVPSRPGPEVSAAAKSGQLQEIGPGVNCRGGEFSTVG